MAKVESLDVYTAPVALDPETGHAERLGTGRTVVIGSEGVARVVTFPATSEEIDVAAAQGDLVHSN